MAIFNILIADCEDSVHEDLGNILIDRFKARVVSSYNKDDAKLNCDKEKFDLICLDPELPYFMDGEDFIRKIRAFHSINEKTPIIMFTHDLEYIADLASEFGIHPEAKSAGYEKILNPIEMELSKHPNKWAELQGSK